MRSPVKQEKHRDEESCFSLFRIEIRLRIYFPPSQAATIATTLFTLKPPAAAASSDGDDETR
jgi:hypothetical protein